MRLISMPTVLLLATMFVRPGFAEDPEATTEPESAAPTFMVIMPERLDHTWYWVLYGESSQHIVQTAIEKALIREGFEVVDAALASGVSRKLSSIDDLLGLDNARAVAEELGADYLITGQATAGEASVGTAYGVRVVRANAEISARLVRIADAKVLDVFDASATEGGQAIRSAGQDALKTAGKDIAIQVRNACRELLPASPLTAP